MTYTDRRGGGGLFRQSCFELNLYLSIIQFAVMQSKPVFKRLSQRELVLGYTAEARRVAANNRTTAPPALSLSGDIVKKNAVSEVRQGGGDVADRLMVLVHSLVYRQHLAVFCFEMNMINHFQMNRK